MPPAKWRIVAHSEPPDTKASEEESRWLKLADDALHNRDNQGCPVKQLTPGSRALGKLQQDGRELRQAVRKLQQANKAA